MSYKSSISVSTSMSIPSSSSLRWGGKSSSLFNNTLTLSSCCKSSIIPRTVLSRSSILRLISANNCSPKASANMSRSGDSGLLGGSGVSLCGSGDSGLPCGSGISGSLGGSRDSGFLCGSGISGSLGGSRDSGFLCGSGISGSLGGSRDSGFLCGSGISGSLGGSRDSGFLCGSGISGSLGDSVWCSFFHFLYVFDFVI